MNLKAEKMGNTVLVECKNEAELLEITEGTRNVIFTNGYHISELYILEDTDMEKNTKTFTKEWLKAASIRAVRTLAQTALATIGTSSYFGDVKWAAVISASVLAAILSILTALAGLPEVKEATND